MNGDHRREYHRAWPHLTPPWRPHPDVVEAVRHEIGDCGGPTLLLGVTPELADISPDLVALDRNYAMVAELWPGNTTTRRALVGDWRNGNFLGNTFIACVGDGSLCGLEWPGEHRRVLTEVSQVLRSGGKFVCRVYAPPPAHESASAVSDAALSGAIRGFHVFKMRLAMALAGRGPERRVCVSDILGEFDRLVPDRDELVRLTGWNRDEIDTIDFYRSSAIVFNFPTREQLLSVASEIFPTARLADAGRYELAQRCPILVAERG
jgi:SAM-dependent methyltransferase